MAQFISGQVEQPPQEKFKSFLHSLTSRRTFGLLAMLFLVLVLPLTVYVSLQKQEIRQHASEGNGINFYGKSLKYLQLFGQTNYTETSRNGVTQYGVYHASGVHIDQTSTPNKVYVVDRGNNRVLAYNGIGYCKSRSPTPTLTPKPTRNPTFTPIPTSGKTSPISWKTNGMSWSADNFYIFKNGRQYFPGTDITYGDSDHVPNEFLVLWHDPDGSTVHFYTDFSKNATRWKIKKMGGSVSFGDNFYSLPTNVGNLLGQSYRIATVNIPFKVGTGLFHFDNLRLEVLDTSSPIKPANEGATCNTNAECGPNSTCIIDGTKPADIVIGQPNFSSASCNGDNNLGINTNPSANSLCLLNYPLANNTAESWSRANIDTDSQGNLYVLDMANNRALTYKQPFSSDKTDGKGDATADFVWGQNDFSSNIASLSQSGLSTANSKYLGGTSSTGVSVDNQGNVWVADTFNSRVLRFPKDSKQANLVLGQPDFTSSGCAYLHDTNGAKTGYLDKLCTPTLAKINPTTGDLYILDESQSRFQTRILIFKPDPVIGFTNGMAAYRIIIPQQKGPLMVGNVPYNTFRDFGICSGDGCYAFQSTGFTFNPFYNTTDPNYLQYAKGKIWVTEHQLFRTLLLDDDGNIIATIGTPDFSHIGGDSLYGGSCGKIDAASYFNVFWPGGSLAFDSSNNIYLADENYGGRIGRYSMPYTLSNNKSPLGLPCLPKTTKGLFPGGAFNVVLDDVRAGGPLSSVLGDTKSVSDITKKIGESVGLAVFHDDSHNQLIVQDEGRLKIWDNYLSHSQYGDPPDYVIPDPQQNTDSAGLKGERYLSAGIDDGKRLWLFNQNGGLRVYQLPFSSNQNNYIAESIPLYWNDEVSGSKPVKPLNYNGKITITGTLSLGNKPHGIAPADTLPGQPIPLRVGTIAYDKVSKAVYVVDAANNRILRIKNYNDLNTVNKLVVDMVIGQPDKITVGCNHTQAMGWLAPGPIYDDGLCLPTQIKFDNYGNLYVVENSYECHGNDRITMFTADDIRNATPGPNGVAFGLHAKKTFIGALTADQSPFPDGYHFGYWPTLCGYDTRNQPGSPVSIAFDSKNRMVVGDDGYYGDTSIREFRQLWVYNNPLKSLDSTYDLSDVQCPHKNPNKQPQCPDYAIDLPMGTPGEIAFDQSNNDNLLIQDHTWYKVWSINLNQDPIWLIPAIQNTPTSTLTPSPTLKPTVTPTLTPSPTNTPTPTPSKTTKISWKTKDFSLEADNFYMILGGRKYISAINTYVYSQASSNYFGATWKEDDGITVQFVGQYNKTSTDWKITKIGATIDFSYQYYVTPTMIGNKLGQPYVIDTLDINTASGGILHFNNLTLQVF